MRALIREWRWIALTLVFVLIALLLSAARSAVGSVEAVSLWSILISLLLLPAAVGVLFVSLRLRDRLAGLDWSVLRRGLHTGNTALAIYLASWVIGVSLIVSAVLG